jgi:hypothetical protein
MITPASLSPGLIRSQISKASSTGESGGGTPREVDLYDTSNTNLSPLLPLPHWRDWRSVIHISEVTVRTSDFLCSISQLLYLVLVEKAEHNHMVAIFIEAFVHFI